MAAGDSLRGKMIVAVLGMHRSGTSLSTELMQRLGATISEDLVPAAAENPRGYFESSVISGIQEQLLNAFGGSMWWTSTTLNPMPDNWWLLPAVQPYRQRLLEYVKQELARCEHVWAFKDPRTARLLPMWNTIIDELGVEAKYVLVVRDPIEVAGSLHTRQKMSQAYAELLWLEHNSDAATYGANRLKAIVEYRHWFGNPVEQATYLATALGMAVPDSAKLEDTVRAVVSKDLRHHEANGAPNYELPFTRDVYDALLARDIQRLELLSQIFNISRTFFTRLIALHQQGKLQGAAV